MRESVVPYLTLMLRPSAAGPREVYKPRTPAAQTSGVSGRVAQVFVAADDEALTIR